MRTREWALVAFTLLMQASIGTVVVLAAIAVAGGPTDGGLDTPLAIAVGAGAVAIVCSLLHLGHPAQAWLAVANLRGSWLSREVAASTLFVLCAALALVTRGSPPQATSIRAAAAVLGFIALYAMSRLYMVAAQPAWNRLLTPVAFFVSTLLLGSALVMVTAAADPSLARRTAAATVALAIAQILLTPAFVAGLPREPAAALAIAPGGPVAILSTAMRIVSALVAVVMLAATSGAQGQARVGAFVLLLVSELAGRVLFYAGRASLSSSTKPVSHLSDLLQGGTQ